MRNRVVLAVSFLSASLPLVALAQWQSNGVPVCGSTTGQASQIAVSDGAGGAIVAWVDTRSGPGGDIYTQRIDGSGMILWNAAGVPLCTAASTQEYPVILSDNAGGAIVAWHDFRSGSSDIYAQRVDGTGAVQWTADGVAVCTVAGNQYYPAMTTNGSGGAIVVWEDWRPLGSPDTAPNIFGARLTSTGVLPDGANGIAISTANFAQRLPTLLPWFTGGALVAWTDSRNLATATDIYAARVTSTGVVGDPLGLAICQHAFVQSNSELVSDGAGGAIIAWYDARTPVGVYAQRLANTGVTQWTANGLSVSGGSPAALDLPIQMLSDGAGGAIASWAAGTDPALDVYAQRINASGARQWLPNDVAVCASANRQWYPSMATDNAGGVVVSWMDERNGTDYDVYAQRVNSSGAAQWTPDGVVMCDAVIDQTYPAAVSDGAGGAIAAWTDTRDDVTGVETQVYAQRVYADGQTPTDVADAPSAAFTVLPARPNPFAATTDLEFRVKGPSDVSIEVYDVAGRRVRSVTLPDVPAGWRRFAFDGRTDSGRALPSGVYFCRVTVSGTTQIQKMVLLR